MFTGIVEALGRVAEVARSDGGKWHLAVEPPGEAGWRLRLGESVAVNGVCLTVVGAAGGRLQFDVAEETRRVTTLGDLGTGDPVNLERPLKLDDRLGGHLVLGHVDAVGRVRDVRPEGDGRWMTVEVPPALRPFLVAKGSVAVDGVSLTVAGVAAAAFSVALIPHTLAVTTLGGRGPGSRVNLETDVIGKYVRGFLEQGERGVATEVAG
jgi:riboflavin synthase